MSSTPKIAVIAAASIGMVLTQSSSLLAEKQDTSAPQKVAKIATPIDLDEEVLYSALPDEVLERAAGFGGFGVCNTQTCNCNNKGQTVNRKVPPLAETEFHSRSKSRMSKKPK
jgi:hypothetical protein